MGIGSLIGNMVAFAAAPLQTLGFEGLPGNIIGKAVANAAQNAGENVDRGIETALYGNNDRYSMDDFECRMRDYNDRGCC